jgi:hypothetical protein
MSILHIQIDGLVAVRRGRCVLELRCMWDGKLSYHGSKSVASSYYCGVADGRLYANTTIQQRLIP